MKRGHSAFILILVLVVAALSLFLLFDQLSPTGEVVHLSQGVQERGAECCKTGVSTFAPMAKVKPMVRCRQATSLGMKSVMAHCKHELNAPVEARTCQVKNQQQGGGYCQVDVCCTN